MYDGSHHATVRVQHQVIGEVEAASACVIFVHGLLGRGKNLLSAAKALTPEAWSLLLDLPDHGASEWSEVFSYEAYAQAVAEACREHIEQAKQRGQTICLVGHSLGGKVAMVLALLYPDLLDRLVVVDIAPTRRLGSGFEHIFFAIKSLDLASLTHRRDADALLAREIPEHAVRGFVLQNLRSDSKGFYWQPNIELLGENLAEIAGFPNLEGHTYPGSVLWLAGELSPYIRDDDRPVMQSLFPAVRKVTIRGAGHWVHADKPEEFVQILRSDLFRAGHGAGKSAG